MDPEPTVVVCLVEDTVVGTVRRWSRLVANLLKKKISIIIKFDSIVFHSSVAVSILNSQQSTINSHQFDTYHTSAASAQHKEDTAAGLDPW